MRIGNTPTSAVVAVCLALALLACGTTWQKDGTRPEGRHTGDGSLDQPLSPFDTGHVALANLDPALLAAVTQAAVAAREDGIDLRVTSGWRSAEYQRRLLDEAVARYGSLDEARKFVNTPEESTHVSGKGIDIGPTDADDWLIRHGSRYGLCQTYANEMWHFELMTTPGGRCPVPLTDASDRH